MHARIAPETDLAPSSARSTARAAGRLAETRSHAAVKVFRIAMALAISVRGCVPEIGTSPGIIQRARTRQAATSGNAAAEPAAMAQAAGAHKDAAARSARTLSPHHAE